MYNRFLIFCISFQSYRFMLVMFTELLSVYTYIVFLFIYHEATGIIFKTLVHFDEVKG